MPRLHRNPTRSPITTEHEPSHHTDTARLEAFSDGVFAIAITLLIIEVAVPHVEGDADLGAALRDLWPSYFGYGLSFITIGIMWINHHGQYKEIERVDHTSMVLNLLLLMCIAFVPFPAAVLAEYLQHDAQLLAATLLYGGTYTVMGLLWNAHWLYSSRGRRLIDPHISDARVRSRTRRNLAGPVLYGLGLPLALIDPWVALGLYVGLAALYLLPVGE